MRLEVLRGVANERLLDRMKLLFDVLPEIPLTSRLLHESADLAWEMDRIGKVLPLPDLVIAQCALQQDATLVSTDDHFRAVPGLKWARTLPAR